MGDVSNLAKILRIIILDGEQVKPTGFASGVSKGKGKFGCKGKDGKAKTGKDMKSKFGGFEKGKGYSSFGKDAGKGKDLGYGLAGKGKGKGHGKDFCKGAWEKGAPREYGYKMAPKAGSFEATAGAVPKSQPARPKTTYDPKNPWIPVVKQDTTTKDGDDGLKGFLNGAPVPGERWDNGEADEDVVEMKAASEEVKSQKEVENAGLLAGVFGDAPAFISKNRHVDEIGETQDSEEPPTKSARTSVASLLAGLPAPKTG